MVNLGICSTSLEPLPGDGYLYREASISDHRTYLSLVECYKMSFVIIILTLKFFLKFTTTKSTTANHSYKLYVKSTRLNCYKHSFFTRIAKLQHDLPKDIVEADSLHLFKSKRKNLSQCLTNNCLFLVLQLLLRYSYLFIYLQYLLFWGLLTQQ